MRLIQTDGDDTDSRMTAMTRIVATVENVSEEDDENHIILML